jgi:hypothetical protein
MASEENLPFALAGIGSGLSIESVCVPGHDRDRLQRETAFSQRVLGRAVPAMGVTRVISQRPSSWLILYAEIWAAWIVNSSLRTSRFHNGFNLVMPQ